MPQFDVYAKGEYKPKPGEPTVWFTLPSGRPGLSREEQVAFVAALLRPSQPGPRLQRAIERYRNANQARAMPNNQHPSQRIGVAKGAFEVPDTIDASNGEVVALLLGEPMRKQEIERVRNDILQIPDRPQGAIQPSCWFHSSSLKMRSIKSHDAK